MTMENNSTHRADASDDIISLSEIVGIILNGKWWIASATGIFMLASLAYLWLATPVHRADALIQVESQKSPLGSLVDMGEAFAGESAAVTEIEVIRSRFILGRVAETEKLNIVAEPDYFPVLGKAVARRFTPGTDQAFNSPLLGMSGYAWGGESIAIERFKVPTEGESYTLVAGESGKYLLTLNGQKVLEGRVGESATSSARDVRLFISKLEARPGTRFNLAKLPMIRAIGGLSSRLSVSEKGRNTGILSLAITGPDKQANKRHLNAIAQRYLRQNVERVSAEAQNSLVFLEAQLPDVRAPGRIGGKPSEPLPAG